MAYSSVIDFPSDTYGVLTDFTPVLVAALNKARMSRSTFELLQVQLKQATSTLNKSVKADLESFEKVELGLGIEEEPVVEATTPVPSENTPTETPVNASSPVGEGNDINQEQKPATDAKNSTADDLTPLPASTPEEDAQEASEAAEIAAAEAEAGVILKPQ